VKARVKALLLWLHRLGTRAGIHVLPVHYYSPVPDLPELERTREVWARRSELPGLDADVAEQAAHLEEVCLPYQREYLGSATYREGVRRHFGPGYGFIEAQALHAVVRHFKPHTILEVGSGVSTLCLLAALERNRGEEGPRGAMTCVEPYPSRRIQELADERRVRLIPSPVQAVPLSLFTSLGKGDLLFIDSTHTVKPGGDVNYLILEVLPRLAPGVVVHFHDIYLPYDYQRNVLRTFYHWQETSLLRAFLIHNDRVRVLFHLSQLHYDRPDALRAVFPEYRPAPDEDGLEVGGHGATEGHFPASSYLVMGRE
jgi:predicted O-methyltransferase YrrM